MTTTELNLEILDDDLDKWPAHFIEHDPVNNTYAYRPLDKSLPIRSELKRLGFEPTLNIIVDEDNWVKLDDEIAEDIPFQSHIPAMPGDPGPTGYPLAYTQDGALIEYFEWSHPIVVMRGRAAIQEKLKEYEDRCWAHVYAVQNRIDTVNVCLDYEKRFRSILQRYGSYYRASCTEIHEQDKAIRFALAWVLGETDVEI